MTNSPLEDGAVPAPALNIAAVQSTRKWALLVLGAIALGVLLCGHSLWPDEIEDGLHETIESIGLGLMLVAIAGRTWCSLYIGGRKKAVVVDVGPYSICRNPLYVFSFIGAAGAGAQFGAFSSAFAATLITVIVFVIVVRKEERYLAGKFGEAYLAYKARVPRFVPDFRLWRNVNSLDVRPQLVVRTFADACVFLAAIPLAEGIEMLQNLGYLPVWWLVP